MHINVPAVFSIEKTPKFYSRNKLSFGEAQVNILATSDNHGHIEKMPYFYSTVIKNLGDIFPQKLRKSVVNVLAVPGDWFIDLKQKSYKTKNTPESIGFKDVKSDELTSGYYSIHFMNQFVRSLTDQLKLNGYSGAKNPFRTFYVPGNHCLEDGDSYLVDVLKQADKNMTTVMTNVNINRSPVLHGMERIAERTIIKVPDSKDKSIKRRVFVLGLTNNSIDFYCKNKTKGIDIIDRTAKKTENLDFEKDINKTCEKVFKEINEFKKLNPKGAVVILSHNGNPFAAALVDHLDRYNAKNETNLKIDLILNGHDHKDHTVYVGKNDTPVVSLGQNNNKFESINLHFDDEGKLSIKTKNYNIDKKARMLGNPLAKMLIKLFKLDFKRNIRITLTDPQSPGKVLDSVRKLSCEDIRVKNSAMANFVTDSIFDRVRAYDKDVEIFGISSASIRGDLPVNKKSANNFELINVLCGVNEEGAKLFVGNVKGEDLAKMLFKNLSAHMVNEPRNELLQWSSIRINKDKIFDFIKQNAPYSPDITISEVEKLVQFIDIKDPETGEYKPIELSKDYRISLPLEVISGKFIEVKDQFEELKCNDKGAKDLLSEYIEVNNNKISIPDPASDVRVITHKNGG